MKRHKKQTDCRPNSQKTNRDENDGGENVLNVHTIIDSNKII